MTSHCPTEEVLYDYLADQLSADQREKTEAHLSACVMCRELLSVFDGVQALEDSEDLSHVPDRVTLRAQKMVQGLETPTLTTRLDRGFRDFTHTLRRWGHRLEWFFGSEPILVRNGEQMASQDVVVIKRKIGDMDALIEIEKCGEDKACLRIDITGANVSLPAVRVTLKTGSREIASSLCDSSPALFEDIPFNSYVLVFSQKDIILGDYAFELRDTRNGH